MRPMSKKQAERKQPRGAIRWLEVFCLAGIAMWGMGGCAMPHKPKGDQPPAAAPGAGVLVSGRAGAAVSWDEMMADLQTVRVVYVGEKHTSVAHHAVQLRVIRELHARDPRLAVGMEMFDRSYQAALDPWSAGGMDEEAFLRSTHWYANWRFDFALYRDILEYVKSARLRLVALNLPFNIPPKIRVGGIEHLSAYEKGFLPAQIDTTIAAHREFAQKIFSMHDFKTGVKFEDFYLAQCVWEEVMAASVADLLGADRMVVLAGNGHIQFNYGIPERAFRRNGVPYRTIYQASAGEEVDPSIADYIILPQ
jgi:uncharacterized iron-regulated protein